MKNSLLRFVISKFGSGSALFAVSIFTATPLLAQSPRVILTPEAGYAITWNGNNGGFSNPDAGAGPLENVALTANGSIAFGSSELDFGVHYIQNVNDGLYGNSASWIANFSGNPDPDPFIGINFNKRVNIQTIAWGRDNGNNSDAACGGTCKDRAVGVYTVQYTKVENPDNATAETGDAATGWVSIGTVEYLPGVDDTAFTAYLRHHFQVALNGKAIEASGVRIKVSSNQLAIDEIEVNPQPDPLPPLSNFIVIEPAEGYRIAWNGNDGKFFDGATEASAPLNLASRSKGATAFGSSEFGSGHFIANANDGLYGNSHSWIANFAAPDPNPFIGITFGNSISLRSIAWSRDNGDSLEAACGGECADRSLGIYTIQYTEAANPGKETPENNDPSAGWVTLGRINYKASGAPFTPHLRHRFSISTIDGAPLNATGIRIKTPDANTAIDEIEINVNPAIEDNLLVIAPATNYAITWDGNDGEFFDPADGASAPPNAALASEGTIPFGSSELNFGVHFIHQINDGLYGNSKSWIADFSANPDPAPFIGLNFGKLIRISEIAWSRDNGNSATDCCGGQLRDRWQGVYTLQMTRRANPGLDTSETADPETGWVTLGTVELVAAAEPDFNPWLRHQFSVSNNGQPIAATGLRIKVPTAQICIDEIEVETSNIINERPQLTIVRQGAEVLISWSRTGMLESTTDLGTTWNEVSIQSPQRIPIAGTTRRFYRVRAN